MVVSPGKVVSNAPWGPSELEGFLGRTAGEQAVKQAGGETVTAADPVDHVELDGRADVFLAVEPEDRRPVVAVGGVDFPQGGGDEFHVRVLIDHAVDELEERVGIELGLMGFDIDPGDAEALLQVFLVADEGIDIADDLLDHLHPRAPPRRRRPRAWRGS